MPEVVDDNSLLVLFADNAKLSREIRGPEDKDIEQEDVNKLKEWAGENGNNISPCRAYSRCCQPHRCVQISSRLRGSLRQRAKLQRVPLAANVYHLQLPAGPGEV